MRDFDADLLFAIAFALRSLDPWPWASDVNLPSRRLAKEVAEHLRLCGYIITKKAPDPPPSTGRVMAGPDTPEPDDG